jgi:hypothetical protein
MNGSATATIAAAGAAHRLVFFTPEGSDTIATVASVNLDGSFVDKFHISFPQPA